MSYFPFVVLKTSKAVQKNKDGDVHHKFNPTNPNFNDDIAEERLEHKSMMLYNDKDNH